MTFAINIKGQRALACFNYQKTSQKIKVLPRAVKQLFSAKYNTIFHSGFKPLINRKASLEKIIEPSFRMFIKPLSLLKLISIQNYIINEFEVKSTQNNLNWTRGRISGNVSRIIIENGLIIEKIFITKKGTEISVKRSELGILQSLLS